jgi:hypothetical protein
LRPVVGVAIIIIIIIIIIIKGGVTNVSYSGGSQAAPARHCKGKLVAR